MSPHQWSYKQSDIEHTTGPISEPELVQRLKDGSINHGSLVMSPTRTKGKWVLASKIPALAKFLKPKQPEEIAIVVKDSKSRSGKPPHSVDHILGSFQPLEPRSKPTIWLLRTTMTIMAINCGTIWLLCQDGYREHRVLLEIVNVAVFAIQSIFLIATAVFFLRWKYRAYKNLQIACEKPLNTTAGWSCGVYFIPLLNVFRPATAMHEIQSRSKANIGITVYAWWILWVIGGIIANATLRSFTGRLDDRFFNVSLLNFIVILIAGFLMLKIIKTITEKQSRYLAALQDEAA